MSVYIVDSSVGIKVACVAGGIVRGKILTAESEYARRMGRNRFGISRLRRSLRSLSACVFFIHQLKLQF